MDIRFGKISGIDYKTGMVAVTYPDKDDSTSVTMPCLSFGQEYFPPKIGDGVIVLYTSTNQGVCAGNTWNEKNRPMEGKKGITRKEFSSESGIAYIQFDAAAKRLIIQSPELILKDGQKEIALKELIERLENIERFLNIRRD